MGADGYSTATLINKLDPEVRSLNDEKLSNLLEYYEDTLTDLRIKSPDYLVIDDFMQHFELDESSLLEAKAEIEFLFRSIFEGSEVGTRQDMMMWLNNLTEHKKDL